MSEEFQLELLTEEDKVEILKNQMKDLEGQHFYLSLIEPSKIGDPTVWANWDNQVRIIESTLRLLREKMKDYE